MKQSKECIKCKTLVVDVQLTTLERQVTCKKHKMLAMCGLPDYICQECKAEGWYSTAGWGGPRELKNGSTGECIPYN
jgi:hypothetical protein